jgi:hypothetical protein
MEGQISSPPRLGVQGQQEKTMRVTLKKWEKSGMRRAYVSGGTNSVFVENSSKKKNDTWRVRAGGGTMVSGSELDAWADRVVAVFEANGMTAPTYFNEFWDMLPAQLSADI